MNPGVTHIINTASRDVWLPVEKLSNLGVKLIQFHVDDIPTANISAYFTASANFLAQAMESGHKKYSTLHKNATIKWCKNGEILFVQIMSKNHALNKEKTAGQSCNEDLRRFLRSAQQSVY